MSAEQQPQPDSDDSSFSAPEHGERGVMIVSRLPSADTTSVSVGCLPCRAVSVSARTAQGPRLPRKGTSHTWEDVPEELCDVILTAMVALATLTPDAHKVSEERLSRTAERSLA